MDNETLEKKSVPLVKVSVSISWQFISWQMALASNHNQQISRVKLWRNF